MSSVSEVEEIEIRSNFNAHWPAHRYKSLVHRRGEREASHEITERKI